MAGGHEAQQVVRQGHARVQPGCAEVAMVAGERHGDALRLGLFDHVLSGCVRVETLSLLSPPADASYFDRTVIASAEAMYFIKE